MKRFITIFFLVFIFVSINFAQARKIDEFAITFAHENQFRLYEFVADFSDNPKSFGQIIVYRGEKDTIGFPHRIGATIASFITIRSETEKSRIITTHCKAEQSSRVELWIVPKFEELRTCENDFFNLTKTILFDSIYGSTGNLMGPHQN
jgi:hypothetical protein